MPATTQLDEQGRKRCTRCGEYKPIGAFGAYSRGALGLRPRCRECDRAHNAQWRAANPERVKEYSRRTLSKPGEVARRAAYKKRYAAMYPERVREGVRVGRLKRKYGLTPDAFNAMVASQNGRCAICGAEPPEGQPLHVDHDHDSGRVRGLLCNSCNVLLGYANERIDVLASAINYLNTHTLAPVTSSP